MPAKPIAFFIAFAGLLFFPSLHLLYFTPFLVICIYKDSKVQAVRKALLCGLFVDLFTASTYFGVSALLFSLTTFILYSQKRNFFEDKLSTLPLMSLFFGLLYTLFFGALSSFIHPCFSMKWLIADWLGMSLFDSLYTFLLFSLPFQITPRIVKLFLLRRRHESLR